MSVPALRFPEFEGDWRKARLGEVGKVIRGASPRPKGDPRYYGGNVPRLMGEDVTRDGKYVTPKIDTLTEEGALLSRPCPAGTLTIICSGNVGIPSILAVDACIHDGFLALVDISSDINTDYLYAQLSRLRAKFDSSATHGGVFVNLTTDILREFPATFPSLPEQKKIAAFLGVVDAKLAGLRARRDGLERYKRGLMQKLFSRTLSYLKKYARPTFEGVCSSEIWAMRGKSVSNSFLYFVVQGSQFNQLANISSGSKMPRSDWNTIADSEFEIPHPEEQALIANALQAMDAKVQAVSDQITRMEAFKKGLLQQMFV